MVGPNGAVVANLGYLKVGRRRLITRQHLEQFLAATPAPPPSPAAGRKS
jgi:hypothetical protein